MSLIGEEGRWIPYLMAVTENQLVLVNGIYIYLLFLLFEIPLVKNGLGLVSLPLPVDRTPIVFQPPRSVAAFASS